MIVNLTMNKAKDGERVALDFYIKALDLNASSLMEELKKLSNVDICNFHAGFLIAKETGIPLMIYILDKMMGVRGIEGYNPLVENEK